MTDADPRRGPSSPLPPIYRPTPDARPPRFGRYRMAALACALAVAGGSAALANSQATTAYASLEVRSVTVSAEPTHGSCPATTFVFEAVIDTNGAAGQVSGQWIKPDGSTTPTTARRLNAGQHRLTATLRYVVSGGQPAHATAAFQIVEPPTWRPSAPASIDYTC